MKLSRLHITLLALGLVLTVACGKNKSDDSVSVNGREARVGGSGASNLPTGQSQLNGTGTQVVAQNTANFDEMVKIFLAPTMDPADVGTVDPRTGVEIRGRVSVHPTNGSALNDSQIQLIIRDSLVSSTIPPIDIRIANATGTAINGNVNLTFQDEYGIIRITGTYNYTTFSGRVDFENREKTYNNKKSGTLGTFQIATCAFFLCQ
ncbi:MAG: hypothetical protein ACAH59_11480 [Pseudobdellovibrionaceae bacterium]